jgi:hypothetical protein
MREAGLTSCRRLSPCIRLLDIECTWRIEGVLDIAVRFLQDDPGSKDDNRASKYHDYTIEDQRDRGAAKKRSWLPDMRVPPPDSCKRRSTGAMKRRSSALVGHRTLTRFAAFGTTHGAVGIFRTPTGHFSHTL